MQNFISELADKFFIKSVEEKYSYRFSWLGRPIIQYPQDMIQIQELIWQVKPDAVIETGIAHGGSLIMTASLLALLDYCDAASNLTLIDPVLPKRKVLGIDIDIRTHNREAIESHPMASRIEMIEGSSIDDHVIDKVRQFAKKYKTVMVFLDSNHTHLPVLSELEAYGPLVSKGSYCVVFDTAIEDLPVELSGDRPWGPGNSPKSATFEYLKRHPEFEIDKEIDNKLLISVAKEGYLKKFN